MFDVFISHSSKDRVVADSLKLKLEASSVRTWKAPDNIQPGQVWEEAITGAISACKIILLIWSADSQDSQQVKRELALAASLNKVVIPFRIQDVRPEGTFAYYLTNTHWLDAFRKDEENALLEVTDRVCMILKANSGGEPTEAGGLNNLGSDVRKQEQDLKVHGIISTKPVSPREDLNVFIQKDSRRKSEASKEIKNQSNTYNANNTEAQFWEACRIEANYSEGNSTDKILLANRLSGARIWLTVDVSLTGTASFSIDGEVFDAAPLGANEYYSQTEFAVNGTINKLYISFANFSCVRVTMLSLNGHSIGIARRQDL